MTPQDAPEIVCPCCSGNDEGQYDELCDRCLAAAMAGQYPHGCDREVSGG